MSRARAGRWSVQSIERWDCDCDGEIPECSECDGTGMLFDEEITALARGRVALLDLEHDADRSSDRSLQVYAGELGDDGDPSADLRTAIRELAAGWFAVTIELTQWDVQGVVQGGT